MPTTHANLTPRRTDAMKQSVCYHVYECFAGKRRCEVFIDDGEDKEAARQAGATKLRALALDDVMVRYDRTVHGGK